MQGKSRGVQGQNYVAMWARPLQYIAKFMAFSFALEIPRETDKNNRQSVLYQHTRQRKSDGMPSKWWGFVTIAHNLGIRRPTAYWIVRLNMKLWTERIHRERSLTKAVDITLPQINTEKVRAEYAHALRWTHKYLQLVKNHFWNYGNIIFVSFPSNHDIEIIWGLKKSFVDCWI